MNCCDDSDLLLSETAASPIEPLGGPSKSWRRRVMAVSQWMLPVATLALIPKCPMCVAAYVLFFTGVGLSLPMAEAIRWVLIAISIAALAYLAIRTAKRFRSRFSALG